MTPASLVSDRFILFTIAGTSYAVPSVAVRHMEMIETVTRVPNAPRSSTASCSHAGRSCRS